MKILVTGGAGFIGSHLVERLMGMGHEVAVIDELNDFYSPELKLRNLADINSRFKIHFVQADICDEKSVSELFGTFRPETVVHLAARAGVRPSLEHPLLYERVNVQGTIVLLEASRRAGVRKFIFGSSSSVYGVTNTVPFSEEDHLNLPISPYAATKIAGEKICYTYSHLYNLSVICLRFFTVYGPRQRPDLAIRKFTEMIDRGQPIPVFGDGTTGRDYTYVDDIADGIVRCLNYDTAYDIFNLGNSHPVSLNEMIRTIETALGNKAAILRLPMQPGDVPITFADISKAQRFLDYSPQTKFSEGIQKFVEWYSTRKRELSV